MRNTVLKIGVTLTVLTFINPLLAIAWIPVGLTWIVGKTIAIKYERNKPLNDKKL